MFAKPTFTLMMKDNINTYAKNKSDKIKVKPTNNSVLRNWSEQI